jgi:hypothetical protein
MRVSRDPESSIGGQPTRSAGASKQPGWSRATSGALSGDQTVIPHFALLNAGYLPTARTLIERAAHRGDFVGRLVGALG